MTVEEERAAAGLRRAAQLIEKPENHIKHRMAADADGNSVAPERPEACKFCLVGAYIRAFAGEPYWVGDLASKALVRSCDDAVDDHPEWPYRPTLAIEACVNDELATHEEVLAILEHAAQLVEALPAG